MNSDLELSTWIRIKKNVNFFQDETILKGSDMTAFIGIGGATFQISFLRGRVSLFNRPIKFKRFKKESDYE
jgi:hypothetical protein